MRHAIQRVSVMLARVNDVITLSVKSNKSVCIKSDFVIDAMNKYIRKTIFVSWSSNLYKTTNIIRVNTLDFYAINITWHSRIRIDVQRRHLNRTTFPLHLIFQQLLLQLVLLDLLAQLR